MLQSVLVLTVSGIMLGPFWLYIIYLAMYLVIHAGTTLPQHTGTAEPQQPPHNNHKWNCKGCPGAGLRVGMGEVGRAELWSGAK